MPKLIDRLALSSVQSKEFRSLVHGDRDRQANEAGHNGPHSSKMMPTTRTSKMSNSANSLGLDTRNGETTAAIMMEEPDVGAEATSYPPGQQPSGRIE